jgi:purine catabolism regulator
MTITVRGLLDRPRLQLTLVGGAGGLDREITWAHASDLPAPWDYLGPSELLLTNGTGIGSSPRDQVHFAERLARIGASGLVVGLGTGGVPLTPELAERAGELELPLLTVPYSIRFSDIVRAVAEANDEHGPEQLGDVAQFYDLLRLSLAAGDLGPRPLTRSAAVFGPGLVDAETGHRFDDQAVVPLATPRQERRRPRPRHPRTPRSAATAAPTRSARSRSRCPVTADRADRRATGGRLPGVAVFAARRDRGVVQLAGRFAAPAGRRQGAETLARLIRTGRAYGKPVTPDLAVSVVLWCG